MADQKLPLSSNDPNSLPREGYTRFFVEKNNSSAGGQTEKYNVWKPDNPTVFGAPSSGNAGGNIGAGGAGNGGVGGLESGPEEMKGVKRA